MKTKLSIIIPVLQEEKIIQSTLQMYNNALKEKYNFEVIVSDGGSTDKTVELCKGLCDEITVHSEQRRQTIAEGRNRGAELAQADTLVFINADTRPSDMDKFFKFINEWADEQGQYKNSVALAAYVLPFPEEKKFIDNFFYGFFNSYFKFLNIIGVGMGRGECQVIRKNKFEEVGGYNNDLVAGEDFELFKKLSKKYKVSFANQLKVYESPRRFRQQGYLRTVFWWTVNGLSVIFAKKSVSKQWDTIR